MRIEQEIHLTKLTSEMRLSLSRNLSLNPQLLVICTIGDVKQDGVQTVYQPSLEHGVSQYQMQQDIACADTVSVLQLPSALPYYKSLGSTIRRPDKSETERLIKSAVKDETKHIRLGRRTLKGNICWNDPISPYQRHQISGDNAFDLLINEVLNADKVTIFVPSENEL